VAWGTGSQNGHSGNSHTALIARPWPAPAARRSKVLFTFAQTGSCDDAQIVVQSLDSEARQTLITGCSLKHVFTSNIREASAAFRLPTRLRARAQWVSVQDVVQKWEVESMKRFAFRGALASAGLCDREQRRAALLATVRGMKGAAPCREPYAADRRRSHRVDRGCDHPQNAGPRRHERQHTRLDERAMARRTSRVAHTVSNAIPDSGPWDRRDRIRSTPPVTGATLRSMQSVLFRAVLLGTP
jgi:hypothetical protein